MNRSRTLTLLLACLIFALLMAFPLASSGGSDPECIRECAEELVFCKKMCKKNVPDPEGQKNCIEKACKEMHKACLEDCRDE